MKSIDVQVTLRFGENEGAAMPDTKGVPYSLILESLENLAKFFAQKLVAEAAEDVREEDQEGYLDGMIALDRIKLQQMLEG